MLRDLPDAALSEIVPVILAGGTGRRLWPLSRASCPKPFLRLFGGPSFLQTTVQRTTGMQAPYIICSRHCRELVMQQVQAGQIILEPTGRGTAPAVATAAHYLVRQGNPLLLVMPADHAIRAPDGFRAAIGKGIAAAKDGMLVTFGVQPHGPSSHYGYIRAGVAVSDGVFKVASFTEKPDRKIAQGYIKQGAYWNSGIFLFSAKSYLENLKAQQPEIYSKSEEAVRSASRLQNSIFLNEEIFSACPALSIDYAVMEHAPGCAVIPAAMGWRDLGTWPSLLASIIKK